MNEDDVVNFWLFQSKLMWSRVQTASVIEAGTLVGWYKVYVDSFLCLSELLLVLGTVLLLIVSLLMRRDAQYMLACEEAGGDRIPKPPRPFIGLSGRKIAFIIPLLLAVCNIAICLTL